MTSVCAPAGYGKTALLSAWTSRLGSRVGWVRGDEADNDAATLCRAVLAAVRLALGDLPGAPDARHGGVRAMAAGLADALEHEDRPVFLVIDDVDRLRAPDAVHVLEMLARWHPPPLRLIFSGRREAVSLHRLRVAGLLSEIRAPDLALREDEVAAVLADTGAAVDAAGAARVLALTAGWPCAVRLVALVMACSGRRTVPDDEVVMTDPAVRDYLEREVLAGLSTRERAVLEGVVVCEEFTVAAAVALTGRPDAVAALETLERDGLVRRAGDGAAYRVQPFVRSYVYTSLRARMPEVVAAREVAAARWCLDGGDRATAARHALRGGDPELMAEIVGAHGPSLVLGGQAGLLTALAEKLPPELLARPEIGLVLALGDMVSGDRGSAELRLAGLSEPLPEGTRLRDLHLIVRTHWARLTGHLFPGMAELDDRLGRIHEVDLTVLGLVNRGTAALWLAHYDAAVRDLEQARRLAERHGFDIAVMHCLSHLAGLTAALGDLSRTRTLAGQAIEFARRRENMPLASRCYAYTLAAWAAYQELDGQKAGAYSAEALKLLGPGNDRTVELGAVAFGAVIDFDHGGDPYAAHVRLRKLWADVDLAEPVQPALVAYLASIEQRMALRLGRPGWAVEAERRAALWLGDSGDVELMRARLLWHQGRTTAVRAHLQKIIDGELGCRAITTRIEAYLLAALLAHRGEDERSADAALRAAVAIAGPRRMMRPFWDTGGEIRELLVVREGRFGRLDGFVADVVAALPSGRPVEAELTAREAQLLRELPSLATVEEIAAVLYVSANTVKTHLRNVYRKLGVTSRREAIVVARQRGLL